MTARVGDNVEIKCDVTGTPAPPIVWRRNDMDLGSLNEDEIKVSQYNYYIIFEISFYKREYISSNNNNIL